MALTELQVKAYLARIGITGRPPATIEALRALQVAHLLAVPFENASVRFREPIDLGEAALVEKLTVGGRGGFCYELNTAFAALLEGLGYRVAHLAARVYEGGRHLGPPYDHMTLRVELDEPWLVDVGFGYSFLAPLRLQPGLVQDDPAGVFRLDPSAPGHLDLSWRHAAGWRRHYRVALEPSPVRDFLPTCWYHQTSPESPFTNGWSCARALPDGWATLSGRHLVVTREGSREERDLADDPDLSGALERWFAVRVPPGADPDPPPPSID
jgi:N-hydroxyarylamine O-acetyltransferase